MKVVRISPSIYVNPDQIVSIRSRIKTDANDIKSVIVLTTGSISLLDDVDTVLKRLME